MKKIPCDRCGITDGLWNIRVRGKLLDEILYDCGMLCHTIIVLSVCVSQNVHLLPSERKAIMKFVKHDHAMLFVRRFNRLVSSIHSTFALSLQLSSFASSLSHFYVGFDV